MVTMSNVKAVSRPQVIALLALLACAVIGAALGWVSMSASIEPVSQLSVQKAPEADASFVLQSAPIEKTEASKVVLPADPTELQIWEQTARLALPPRKEPLTPPRWRIVGVTAVGEEKSVLLLFANQPATEARKVGDKLPGGAKIVQISQDHLQISLNGQLMKLNLRKQ